MLSTTITLKDQSGDDVVFTQVPFQGNGSRRIVKTRELQEPLALLIQHTPATKAGQSDRRAISIRRTESDASGKLSTSQVNLSVTFDPTAGGITLSTLTDDIVMIARFLLDSQITAAITSTANVDGVLHGEA